MEYVCTRCGWHGAQTRTAKRGDPLVALLLWCAFLVPGLIYSLWRQSTSEEVCPACGEPRPIPGDSPIGARLLGALPPAPWPIRPPSAGSVRFGRTLGRLLRR